MTAFQDYEFGWQGQSYVIPAPRLLGVIAAIEEHMTLDELLATPTRRRMPLARISQAYAALLRAAGVKAADGKGLITEQEVYTSLFKGAGASPIQKAVKALRASETAIIGLLSLMLPPDTLKAPPGSQGASGTPGKSVAAPRLSRTSTKRSAARAG